MVNDKRVYLFDSTLRDGAQSQGVDFTVPDKGAIFTYAPLLLNAFVPVPPPLLKFALPPWASLNVPALLMVPSSPMVIPPAVQLAVWPFGMMNVRLSVTVFVQFVLE